MTEQTPADAYIESCLIDLSKQLTAAEQRIDQLEQALAHIYAWYPISVTQPRQTIDDIREFAHAALGEKKDD